MPNTNSEPSFDIREAFQDYDFSSDTEQIKKPAGWELTEATAEAIEFTHESGLVVTIQQVKPIGGDLPFRLTVTPEEETTDLSSDDYAMGILRSAQMYMEGATDRDQLEAPGEQSEEANSGE